MNKTLVILFGLALLPACCPKKEIKHSSPCDEYTTVAVEPAMLETTYVVREPVEVVENVNMESLSNEESAELIFEDK